MSRVPPWFLVSVILGLGVLVASPAGAQSPMRFSLDPVFVSRFLASEPELEVEAVELRALLEAAFGARFLVIPREDVPAFEDYDAEVYLRSCPPDHALGCAFVIGERAKAEWVVTGEVRQGDEGLEGTVYLLDVARSQVARTLGVVLDPEDPDVQAAVATYVGDVLNRVIDNPVTEADVRQTVDTEGARQREWAQSEAEALEQLEGELGDIERRDASGRIDRPRVTEDDLEEYRFRDDIAPWEQVDMNEDQYLRFMNSGRPLDEWRLMMQGRLGQIVFHVGLGYGWGPYSQAFDARWARDHDTLDLLEVEEYLELRGDTGTLADFEVAFGVAPWLEVAVTASVRSADFSWLYHEEVQGTVTPVGQPSEDRVSTWQVGGRVSFVPYPTRPIRPTATLGVTSWRGVQIDRLLELGEFVDPLDPLSLVLVEVGPGVELDVTRQILVFGRASLGVPVGGESMRTYQDGEEAIRDRGEPEGGNALPAFQVTAGLRYRIGPLFRTRASQPEEW